MEIVRNNKRVGTGGQTSLGSKCMTPTSEDEKSHDLIRRTDKWLRRRTARIHAYIVHIFESCKKYFSRGVSRVSLEVDSRFPL